MIGYYLAGASEDDGLESVVREIYRQLGNGLSDDLVRHTARLALDPFREARIRTFVPLLAGRKAVELLRSVAAE